MAYGTVNVDAMTTSDGYTSAGTYGFKNRIINGAMVIDQRNAGASLTPSSGGTYTLDRWRFYGSQASKVSIQQNAGSVTPPAGYSSYLGATSLSAYSVGASDQFVIQQLVEGYNWADMAWGTASASNVTLSFWVRSSLTGSFGGAIFNYNASRSYPFGYTINSANTWEQKSITITGDGVAGAGTYPTNNGQAIYLELNLGSGSGLLTTPNAWVSGQYNAPTGATSVVGTNGATFYITGVQLEKGSTATSFDYRPYGTELQLCQRYYQRSNLFRSGSYYAASATTVRSGAYQFVATMRTNPSITFSSTSFNNASGVSTDGIEVSHFQTYCNTSGAGAFTWEAVIQASAEL